MHPNPIFRETEDQQSIDFARARGFGTLAISTPEAPLLAHVPVLLAKDGSHGLLHMVRSNPIARALRAPAPARLDISGADGYISPDWYGLDDQVPTWNYVAVALTGTLTPLPITELESVLAAQSTFYEARLAPKPPWTMAKMSDETRSRFLRMILPYRFDVSQIDSTWKLGQNKPEPARTAAAKALATGFGQELDTLAALMTQG